VVVLDPHGLIGTCPAPVPPEPGHRRAGSSSYHPRSRGLLDPAGGDPGAAPVRVVGSGARAGP
jgi:hypothetical protein